MSEHAACLDVLPSASRPGSTARPPLSQRTRRPGQDRRRGRSAAGGRSADLRRTWVPYLVAITLLALVCAFVPTSRAQWLVPVGGVIALTALLQAVLRAHRRDQGVARHPFVLLSAGLTLTTVSEVLLATGGAAVPLATPVSLAAYPFLLAGLVALNGTRVREQAVDTLLIAAIVPSTLFAFGWLPLIELLERWAGSAGQAGWASWSLLAVDALCVAVIARLAVLFRGRPIAYQMLLASMACGLGAHIARVVGATLGLVPAPFGAQALLLLSFALVAGACLHPSMRPATAAKTRADAIGHGHVLLLIAVVMAGPVFAVLRYGERGSWVLLATAGPAAVSLLVVAHLARLIQERQRLEYLSTHDGLTGLPNRTAFHDRLSLLLGRATAVEGPSVVFLDLDRFKHVNDTFGHEAGDELLQEVALRLRQAVRADDTVARLAGDEFALLLAAPCGSSRSDDVARRILESFAEPFLVSGAALSVSPSMGVAMAPEHGTDVETLLRNADSAMYAAKASGRNTVRTFLPGMASAAERHLLLEQRFRRAIADGELLVHYQPRIDTNSRLLVGVEALVRWEHPTLGVIPPGAFIGMAESTGAIADLGRWVLEQACRDAASWRAAGLSVTVSVNVSPRQFLLQDVPEMVAQALTKSGLPASSLELELTESMHLSDDGSVGQALARISQSGVTCAVDDFGTGYSSIAVLRDYPIGVVKLDQSFVQPVGGLADAPLVRGVVELARGLGMRVVAEGVETQAQLDFLAGILCDEIQGFLVSRAVPAAHITAVIRDGGGDPSLVPPYHPVILDVNERRLVELLWAEQDGLIEEDESKDSRFVAVLGAAATVMAVPIVLGFGAGGGLPPAFQSSFVVALEATGVEPPRLRTDPLPYAPVTTVLAQPAGTTALAIPLPRRSERGQSVRVAGPAGAAAEGGEPVVGTPPAPEPVVAVVEPPAATPARPAPRRPRPAPAEPDAGQGEPPARGGADTTPGARPGLPPGQAPAPGPGAEPGRGATPGQGAEPGPGAKPGQGGGGAGKDGGRPGTTPGAGTPPGQADTPPGQANTPPGQGGTPPGQAKTPPGQAKTPPGQASTPPGQADTPPGQANTPPGQANTPPGQGSTPPGQGSTPPGQGSTPPGQGSTPPGQGSTPPGQASTPPGQTNTPPGQANTPPGQANTPPGQASTPPGQASTPPGQASTPPGQADTPPDQAAALPADQTSPTPDSGAAVEDPAPEAAELPPEETDPTVAA